MREDVSKAVPDLEDFKPLLEGSIVDPVYDNGFSHRRPLGSGGIGGPLISQHVAAKALDPGELLDGMS